MKKKVEVFNSGNFTRSCVSCGAKRHKNDMLRIAISPDKTVYIDETGRGQGRGCYLCRDAECIRSAIKSGRIARALKSEVPPEILADLTGRADE